MVKTNVLLALLLAGAGCASPGRLPGPARTRAWPRPPETPRIGLLGEIRGAHSLGLEGSFGSRLARFFTGNRAARLHRPYAVAVIGDVAGTGPGGGEARGPARMAVADTGAKVVHLFDLERGEHELLAEVGQKERLLSPVAVAFDGQQRLYVCDSALGMLLRYKADHSFDRILSRGLLRPSGLAVDAAGGILYVSDAAEHTVRRFDLEGKPLGAVCLPLRFPTHLAVDRKGRLIVSDSMNFRVLVLSPEGDLVASTGRRPGDSSGDLQRPKGVGMDSEDHLYIVDALFDNVQIFDLRGRLLLAFGSAGDGGGEFALPAGLAVDERDLIYVADSYNGRIQVFRYLKGGKQ